MILYTLAVLFLGRPCKNVSQVNDPALIKLSILIIV